MSQESSVSNNLIEFSDQSKAIATYDPYMRGTIPDDDINLRDIWEIILKYKWTIISFLTITLALVIMGTLLMRPVYKSTALIEIVPNSKGLVQFQNVGETSVESREFIETQQNIITSESVANSVFEQLQLNDNPEINGEIQQRGFIAGVKQIKKAISDSIKQPEDQNVDQSYQQQRRNLGRYFERLNVNPVRNTNLYSISFESFNPQMAALVSNSIVDEYIRLSDEKRFNSTSGAKEYLNKEIKRIQAKLETSEKELTEFARKNNIVDLEDKNNIINTRINDMNSNLTEVQNQRIEAESNLDQIKSDYNSSPQVLQESLIKTLKEEYATLQAEYFKLSKLFKPAYPKLQQLKAQMDRVEETIDSEVGKIIKSEQVRVNALVEREAKLASQVDIQNQQLLDLQDRSTQYNILKREWETNKELYSGLLERMKEIGVASGLEINNINIIDRATVPTEKSSPKLVFNVLLASIFGLLGGLGLAFLLSYLDNTVQTTADVEKTLNIPNLGLVPKFPENKQGIILELITDTNKNNEMAEAYRSIRTSLMFSSPGGSPKVLMLTSASASEGKTTTIINLAIAYAQNGSRVLLVDADLRKPRIHKVLQTPSSPGLSDFLVGQNKLKIHKAGIDNLHYITAGTIPPNPAELLGSNKFEEFLDKHRQEFDHVIIDCPPILGLADSLIISTKVDGLLFVVQSKKVSRDALQETMKRLRMVRAPVIGAILNNVELNSYGYGLYKEYYYKYSVDKNEDALPAR